ncbi:MAG: hypothetical protein LBC17_03605, partial [Lactobacillaceae bacterium]|nr:hypothetical protein [Lactobacillaceae bacterium]
MKRVDPRQYVQKLQDFITEIDDINEKASEYYLKLIDFIKEDKVNEVDELEYKQTVAEFQDASDKYLELKDKLSNLDIP